MKLTIPIALSFDHRLVMPARVAIFSLLQTADVDQHFDFHLLYSQNSLSQDDISLIRASVPIEHGHSFTCHDVGQAFQEAFEIRGIRVPTYYRLLLPSLLQEVAKVVYLDVDIIVEEDISDIYLTDYGESLIAGVRGIFTRMNPERIEQIGAVAEQYVNAGILVMNLEEMRREGLQEKFLVLARQQFEFQDQDILNICCRDRISHLHPRYNVHCMFDYEQNRSLSNEIFGSHAWLDAIEKPAILHYAGVKPWESHRCWFHDRWWNRYYQSPAFDGAYYRSHMRRGVMSDHTPTVSTQQAGRQSGMYAPVAKGLSRLFSGLCQRLHWPRTRNSSLSR
jgi:UDP-glucose:(galactosyl)LPS alpha-1,2-glucosyltransferase